MWDNKLQISISDIKNSIITGKSFIIMNVELFDNMQGNNSCPHYAS